MSRVDPYNNAPPPRPGGGGGCGGGSCGKSPSEQQQYSGPPVPELQQHQQMPQHPQMPQQHPQQMPQQYPPQEQVPQYMGSRTTEMTQRPMRTPGHSDLHTENQMMMEELQGAVQYIHQLGGHWPPHT